MSETKVCVKCKETKSVVEFSKCKGHHDGLQAWCKSCTKTWRSFNVNKIRAYSREWTKNNPDKVKSWLENNKERASVYQHTYYLKNIEKIKANTLISQRKLKKDPFKRLLANIRVLITFSIPEEHRNLSTLELIGCSKEELKAHIESQFVEKMSWSNYGRVWVIDHILARIRFDMTNPEEQKIAFNYTNMQPLYRLQNNQKHAKIIHNEKTCLILDKLLALRSK